jgi:hypothetical protein
MRNVNEESLHQNVIVLLKKKQSNIKSYPNHLLWAFDLKYVDPIILGVVIVLHNFKYLIIKVSSHDLILI